MKNDNKIDILKYENIEIIDDKEFIEKIKKNKILKEYANLELMRKNELQKVIQRERIEMYSESIFDYVKNINAINEEGKFEKLHIINGQIFTINYQKNTLSIIDKKVYEGHFERTNEYNYFLKDVGIADDEIKVILNNISKVKKKSNQKNDCNFLLYVLANREKQLETKGSQSEKIDNLFKLWNITEKYYTYKQYRIYLNLYEELYMDYLRDDLNINLTQYENIKAQMKEIKKEILKGD